MVRIQVLTVKSTKMIVFWSVALCSLAKTNQRLRSARSDEDIKHVQNVG
jgi:hypothetical protein